MDFAAFFCSNMLKSSNCSRKTDQVFYWSNNVVVGGGCFFIWNISSLEVFFKSLNYLFLVREARALILHMSFKLIRFLDISISYSDYM